MNFASPLPIDAALPELTAALRARNTAVLVAPPGAGKTTRVPLVLAEEAWAGNLGADLRSGYAQKRRRILVLEPRRLAARAAAERMAKTLGEKVGETVGLRVRFGSKVSARTRIEIVTEGVFTRLVLDDPMLEGVAAVLFDEFHERSLDADLGLALARDVQQGLREDLRLVVMSATIDGARVAKLLGDAPVIASEGRAFPVETRYLGRDPRPIEPQMADAIARAVRADAGSVLAFLPGAAEIRRTAAQLEGRLGKDIDVVALYGALAGDEQDRAIAPAAPGRRKIVLATSIAETSITIEGVRIVVDSGLARVPRFEPDVGVTRLETVRVSRAAADQRRGRADASSRASATGCGTSRRPRRSSRLRGRKFCRRIFRPSRSILPPGVRRPSNLLFSTHRRARRSRKQKPCWRSLAPSTPMGASRMKDRSCGDCRCRRGLRAWWSMPRPLAPRSTQPKSRC